MRIADLVHPELGAYTSTVAMPDDLAAFMPMQVKNRSSNMTSTTMKAVRASRSAGRWSGSRGSTYAVEVMSVARMRNTFVVAFGAEAPQSNCGLEVRLPERSKSPYFKASQVAVMVRKRSYLK